MNKQKREMSIILSIMVIAVVGAIGIGNSYAASPTFKITPEVAATIAITHLGVQSSNLVEVDLDKENDSFIYSVDFIIGDQNTSVEIDPQTGKILVVEQETIGAPDTDDDQDDDQDEDDD
ncbi:MAG: hypothetical protein HW410_625 [Nitrosarchaeum sp.]|nr:hypothetical protein [Nitrosarchaeum sp.]